MSTNSNPAPAAVASASPAKTAPAPAPTAKARGAIAKARTVAPAPPPSVGRRHDNWQTLMHKRIKAQRAKAFAWGANDCCTWACDHIQSITDIDVYGEFRGTYTDQKSAFVSIRKITGGATVEDVADHVAKNFAIPELAHPRWASRGDIVLADLTTDGQTQPVLGVVHLCGQVALFVGPAGMQKIPVAQCRRAWRIGGVHPLKKELKK